VVAVGFGNGSKIFLDKNGKLAPARAGVAGSQVGSGNAFASFHAPRVGRVVKKLFVERVT
jgi:hypothetical protein